MWGNANAMSCKDTPLTGRPVMPAKPWLGPSFKLKDKPKSSLKVVEKMQIGLTAEEQFSRYGRIEGTMAIELLDAYWQIEALDGLDGTVREASGCFPDEDVLHEQIRDLTVLVKNMRGGNKEELERIIAEIIGAKRELHDNAEHGRDELRNVLKAMTGEEA